MADVNNDMVANMPTEPHPDLKQLEPLLGDWKLDSDMVGIVTYEWMEGGFFLLQKYDAVQGGKPVKGVEYIGYDYDTKTLRSIAFDTRGSRFAYTWQLEKKPDGNELTIWFGDKDSDTFYKSKFAKDGNSAEGRWQWPEDDGKIGGYGDKMTRIQD